MGILDDLSSAFSKAQAGATRFADTASLKFKLGEAERKRRDLMAQLGESLYAEVCGNPALKAGREAMLAGIAQCEADRAQVQSELDRIAKEAAESKSASFTCPVCGGTLVPGARFCPTCGTRMQPATPQDAASTQASYTRAAPQAQQPQQPGCSAQQSAAPVDEPVRTAPSQEDCPQDQTYEVPEK